jgi:recombination protein RecA
MSPEMTKALEIVLAGVEKKYGKGSVMKLTDNPVVDAQNTISSGSISLDAALGIGGYRRGRLVEIYGPESCIYGDSMIPYEIWSVDEKKKINSKGGTIKRLYERFHNTTKEPVKFFVKSVNSEGSIVRNEVLDVVKTGEKICHQVVTEDGNSLICTEEHKFLTPDGYKPLEELKVGDTIFIHNNTRRKGRKHYPSRPTIMVKYHPYWPIKVVTDSKTGIDYVYYRGQKSRAVYEAFINGISLQAYIDILNTQDKHQIDQLKFLPTDIHVHHLDEDFNNNEITNLKLIDPYEHGRLHAIDRHANLSFMAVQSKITTKEIVGPRETYDIKCAFPHNNYIANGIVVHNSGKTTLCLHAVADAQKRGSMCAFIDAEHALDPKYATALGVNMDSLLVSQPDYGEQALDIAEMLARSGEVGLIVIDSVAALVPKAELEGEMGDSHVGLQARMMSQAMRKLTGTVHQSGCLVIFVNQIRMKIGVLWGSPETTSGGNALKFYASQRLDIRRIGAIKQGDKIVGNRTRVKVAKNKLAPPFRETEFDIKFGIGIDKNAEIIDLGAETNVITKSGSWYSYNDTKIGQGRDNAMVWLSENPNTRDEIRAKIMDLYGLTSLTITEDQQIPQE